MNTGSHPHISLCTCSLACILFTAACGLLHALPVEPTLVWQFSARGKFVSSPAGDDKRIFIGSYDSVLYCLDTQSGKDIWKYRTQGTIGSTALVTADKVIFFNNEGRLYCLNKKDGTLHWSFKSLSGVLPDRRYDWPDYYLSSPISDGNTVYFGAGDGRIYAVDEKTGTLRWSYLTGDVIHTRPALEGDKLVTGSFDGHLYCLNKNTGALLWRFKTTGHRYFPRGEVNGNPVIRDGKIFFGARDYNLYAVDLEAGYCHWLKSFPRGWALAVSASDSMVYAGTSDDRVLIAADPDTGVLRWSANLGFNIFAAPALRGNRGYTGTLNGKVFCVDLRDGEILWAFETDGHKRHRDRYFQTDGRYVDNIGKLLPNGEAILRMYELLGAVFSEPLVVGNSILVACNDGTVYCLRELD